MTAASSRRTCAGPEPGWSSTRDDRVHDELAGAVVRDVAAPVRPHELGADRRRVDEDVAPDRRGRRACRRAGAPAGARSRRRPVRPAPAAGPAPPRTGPCPADGPATRPPPGISPRARQPSRGCPAARRRDGGTTNVAPSTLGGPSDIPSTPTKWTAIDSLPSGRVYDDRATLDAVGGEDRHLRLVDDRDGEGRAERPSLVIENVPPTMSSATSCRVLARSARSRTRLASPERDSSAR